MFSVASQAGLIHLGMKTSKNAIVVATMLPGKEVPVAEPDLMSRRRSGGWSAVSGRVGAVGLV